MLIKCKCFFDYLGINTLPTPSQPFSFKSLLLRLFELKNGLLFLSEHEVILGEIETALFNLDLIRTMREGITRLRQFLW